MPTSTEIFINSELPKRPYTNQFPFTSGHVPVATGVGLQVEARALTTSDISDMSSYATQEDLSNVLADANEYADGLVVGLWDDRGAYTVNAAGNINYPSTGGSGVAGALMKGDIFTVAGAVADVSTINNIAVNNGDTVRALVDNPSATDNAHWAIAENNIGYVPENRANKTTNTDLSGATGTYPDTPTVKSYIDNYDISAASINSTGTVTLTRTESDLTFQVPTAVSGLSFDPNTGVLTSSYTNNATSTTITVAANQVSDNVFRIKDNDDATKKIAFEASGIATGETRTITMPDVDVDLGKMVKGVFTPVELLASANTQNLAPNYSYYLPANYAGALNLAMPVGAAIGTAFDISSIYSTGLDGTSGANLTALNLAVPAGEYITGWGSATSPINLLVSYETASTGYRTPNFTQGCTFRLTKTGATSWAIKPTFGSALPKRFIVKNEGSGGTTVNTTVPSGTSRELTLPNADVNLGNLSSVATTDSNTLSGTRTRILGGSNNTVSGTDNIAIGTTDFMLSSDAQVAIGAGYKSVNNIERVTCADTLILGNAQGYTLTVVHRLRANAGNKVFVADSFNTQLSDTLGLMNTPKAVLRRSYFLNARHELTFTATVYSSVGVKAGTISGVRVFGVHYGVGSTTDTIGDYVITSVTPYADLANGDCSALVTASIVEVAGTKEKLLRINIQAKNATGTSNYLCNSTAELVSHYRLF